MALVISPWQCYDGDILFLRGDPVKFFLLLIIFISACAGPERLLRVSDQEKLSFNCEDIQRELKAAEEHRINTDTTLEPTDMQEAILIMPLMMLERLDVDDAIEHAEKRIEDLEVLQVKKGCSIPKI